MRPISLPAAIAIVLVLTPGRATASCSVSAPIKHGSSFFQCADFAEMADLAYQADNPTGSNSGTVDIACEYQTCWINPDGGTWGDGKVVIGFDWAYSGTTGCPGGVGQTTHRVVIVIQAADGKGLIATLGRGRPDITYMVEAAHKLRDSHGNVNPLPCTDSAGRPKVLQSTEQGGRSVGLTLHFDPPLVYSDCDPDTLGNLVGTCTDGFQPNPAVAQIYTSLQDCKGRADLRRDVRWTDTGLRPDADGNVSLTLQRPAGSDSLRCLLVGASAYIGGYESEAVTGFVRLYRTGCHDAGGEGWSDCEGDCND